MTDKEFDKIWQPVKNVMEYYRMDYGAAVTIGSQFGKLIEEIKRLQNEVNFYKNIAERYEGNK